MSQITEQATSAAHRHIVDRPRLTRLLDEAPSRVIILVAPAGYGKTILARQWLASRQHAWLQASEALSDVVALAVELAKTLATLGPGINERLLGRIQTMRDSPQELQSIADLQARELQPWPDDAWLAIDDYEHIARSEVAEAYVRALLGALKMRLLVTSRVNPSWATPRALLYGEIHGVDRSDLAMRRTETRSVLRAAPEASVREIFELAEGWPALIGLASLAKVDPRWASDASGPLFDYFADELYHRASKPLQAALPQLALASRVTPELAAVLLGPKKGPRLVKEANEIGFFSGEPAEVRLHPLLRKFLLAKLADQHVDPDTVADRLIEFFLDKHDWDDAFELIRERGRAAALIQLCDAAHRSMLASGRTSTLETWLDLAGQLGLTSPVFDLVRAEIALRHGSLGHAERVALNIANDENADQYHSRAYSVAGRAAHLDDRDTDALRLFRSAAATARDDEERHEATWGTLLSVQAFEKDDDVRAVLAEFLAREPESADDLVRAASARLMVGATIGGITDAVDLALDALAGLDHANDPIIRTSFLNALSRTLSLQARYAESGTLADRLVSEAHRSKLEFVLPHAYVAKAVATIGVRNFAEAEALLDRAEDVATQLEDRHNVLDARNTRAKLAIALRRPDHALDLTDDLRDADSVTNTMIADLLGTRGMAQACIHSFDEATDSVIRAGHLSSVPEIRSILACVRAIVRLERDGDASLAVEELEPAFRLSVLDPIIVACRALPGFDKVISRRSGLPVPIVNELRPLQKGNTAGTIEERLTPREAEVLKLISLGYTNREIAKELFIAEVTAKVHVRNIIRKLGVRSRTEAAIAALRPDPKHD